MTVNERTIELSQVLHLILSALKGSNVEFYVLRNYEELPEYTTHDVDVLVGKTQLNHAAESIKQAASRCDWKFAAEVCTGSNHSLYMYYEGLENVQYLTIDLVTDLKWGWMPTINVQYVFATKQSYRSIPVASPGCDSAMRLTKAILRGLPISDKAQEVIQQGAIKDSDSFLKAFEDRLNIKLSKRILNCAQAGDFNKLRELRKQMCMSVFWRFHISQPIVSICSTFKYLIHRMKILSRGPLGICVALLGPDGAGKTTLVNRLSQRAGTLFFRGTKIYHHEFHILPRLKDLARPWRLFYPKQNSKINEQPKQESEPCGLMRSLMYLSYYTIDYCIGHLMLRHLQGRGKLVLFDRYFYDYYFQPGHRKTPHWLIDAFRIFAPKPDIVLLLQAKPEKIHNRKPELTADEIARQINVAKTISDKLKASIPIVTIITDQPITVSGNQAAVAILHALTMKNYGRDMEKVFDSAARTAGATTY